MTEPSRFRFRFATGYRLPAAAFGVTPATCLVTLDAESLRIRFGPWRLATAVTNLAGVESTGPYGYLKTAGPAHLSFADRGLTFATNGERGVCVRFLEPVAGIEPLGLLRHPAVTVTVAEPDRLVAALRDRLR